MSYELNTVINCGLCGHLLQTRILRHKPTDKEIAEFNKEADEDHRKLHELNKIQARFEKIDADE